MKYRKHSTVPGVRRVSGLLVLIALGIASLWIAIDQFLYFGDNLTFHYPARALIQEIASDGLPLWNPLSGGGQPLAGNPNYLTFYPTSLLYVLFSPTTAFNLHFFVHLFIAWFGMRKLLQLHEVQLTDASLVATIYVLSGSTISSLVFYNLIVPVALTPWAAAALIRLLEARRLRDACFLGSICGLLGLSAEPVMAIGILAITGAIFLSRFSIRAIPLISLAVLISILVASPQLLAFAEISAETERTAFHYGVDWALAASIGPDRLAEIFTGPIFGSRLDHSPSGYQANATGRIWTPFLMSVMSSGLLIPAILRRRGRTLLCYQILTLLFLLLSIGRYNPVVVLMLEELDFLSSLRHPEKLMIFFSMSATVLIGLLVRDLRRDPSSFRRSALFGTVLITAIALAVVVRFHSNETTELRVVATAALQILSLVPLVVPSRVRHVAKTAGLLAIVPLAAWAPSLIPLDDAEIYSTPPPVAHAIQEGPALVSPASFDWTIFDSREAARWQAFRLSPTYGVRFGTAYVLYEYPDGIQSYLSRLSYERFRSASPEIASRYLAIYGTRSMIESEPVPFANASLAHVWQYGPESVLHYRLSGSRPFIWEPRELIPVENATEAVKVIESATYDPMRTTVVPSWAAPRTTSELPGSSIRDASRDSQSIRFEIEARRSTVVIVNQTWFSAWKAVAGGEELTTFPADIDRLGIVVPAGISEVQLSFGRRRAEIWMAVAASGTLLLYTIGLAIWSRIRVAVPAR